MAEGSPFRVNEHWPRDFKTVLSWVIFFSAFATTAPFSPTIRIH
jgi:hypothetical protein